MYIRPSRTPEEKRARRIVFAIWLISFLIGLVVFSRARAAALSEDSASAPEINMYQYILTQAGRHDRIQSAGATTCIILSLYDPATRIGFLTHIPAGVNLEASMKPVFKEMASRGVVFSRVQARLVGGFKGWSDGIYSDIQKVLSRRHIPVVQDEALFDMGSTVKVSATESGAGLAVSTIEANRSVQLDLWTGLLSNYRETIAHIVPTEFYALQGTGGGVLVDDEGNRLLVRHFESLER